MDRSKPFNTLTNLDSINVGLQWCWASWIIINEGLQWCRPKLMIVHAGHANFDN